MIPLTRTELAALLITSLLPLSRIAAQEGPSPLPMLHVTSVDAAADNNLCPSDSSCSADGTKYTVKGYITSASKTTRTEYKLECVEIRQLTPPPPKLINYCERVHAGHDYKVSVLDDAIVIGGVHAAPTSGPREAAYEIVSER